MDANKIFFHTSYFSYLPNRPIYKSIDYQCEQSYKKLNLLLENLHTCTTKESADNIVSIALASFDQFIQDNNFKFAQAAPDVFSFMMREVIAENVRVNFFQDYPSRYRSLFIVDNFEDALKFYKTYRDDSAYIYECRSVAPSSIFAADMELINHSNAEQVNPLIFRENMYKYWRGADSTTKTVELLCPCPLIALKKVYPCSP